MQRSKSQETCLLEYRIFRTTSNWLYVFIHHDWRVMVFMLVFEKENGLFSYRRGGDDKEKAGAGIHDRHLCSGCNKGGRSDAAYRREGLGNGSDPSKWRDCQVSHRRNQDRRGSGFLRGEKRQRRRSGYHQWDSGRKPGGADPGERLSGGRRNRCGPGDKAGFKSAGGSLCHQPGSKRNDPEGTFRCRAEDRV